MPRAKDTRRWPKTDPPPDRHAPRAISPRPRPDLYHEPDEIERECCTMEWSGGRWQHERSCPLRLAAR
jgi:hypothetical protein